MSFSEIRIIVRHVDQLSSSFLVEPIVSEDLCGQQLEFPVGSGGGGDCVYMLSMRKRL